MNDQIRAAITKASGTSAVLAAVLSPIPLADEIILIPVFGVLATRIGKHHGLSAGALPWRAISVTALSGLTARATLNLAVSFIPGVAAVANAASAVALTEFFGRFVDEACAQPAEAKGVGVKAVFEMLKGAVKRPATAAAT